MANTDSTAAALNALEPVRREIVLEAAHKLEILADALVAHSGCAERFEDVETAISIVSSVARRQSKRVAVIIRALDGVSTDSIHELSKEAHNG